MAQDHLREYQRAVDEAKAALERATKEAKSRAGEYMSEARDVAEEQAAKVRHMVQEKPWQALGLAAAVGAAIGLLFSVGRRR